MRRKLQRVTALDLISGLECTRRMTDYFFLMGESRRPWLDPEAVKARFLALAAEVHPDRLHHASQAEKQIANQRYAELNAAYNCLRETKQRLLHLLELERGNKPEGVQKVPSATMDLFIEVSELCRAADAFLAEKAETSSPLIRARLFERGMMLTDKLNCLWQNLNAKRDALIEQLKNLNMVWESAPPVGSPARVNVLPCGQLDHLYRDFSYLTRWAQQIRERVVQLSSL